MKTRQENQIDFLTRYHCAIAIFICLFAMEIPAKTAPIIFTFSGTGTGGVSGGAPFSDARFTIRLFGETDNVVPLLLPTHPEINAVMVNCSYSDFSISGYGAGMFTVPTVVFDNLTFGTLGFAVAVPGGLPSDVLDINAPEFLTYGLTGSLRPVGSTDASYLSFIMPTTLGNLTLDSAKTISFDAVVVPEPSVPVLLFGSSTVFAFTFFRRLKPVRRDKVCAAQCPGRHSDF